MSATPAPAASAREPGPCPFCGSEPRITERPGDDPTKFFCFIACYCGGYSACAHKVGRGTSPERARAAAIAAWNARPSPAEPPGGVVERLTADRDRLRKALEDVRDDLTGGFVRCATCGDQEDTSDLDCMSIINAALTPKERPDA